MKKIILTLIATTLVCVNGYILYALSHGAAIQFQKTFDSFGVTPPKLTSILFSNIEYWWLLLTFIGLLSFVPTIFGKLKTSIAISTAFIASLIAVVYGPMIQMSSVI